MVTAAARQRGSSMHAQAILFGATSLRAEDVTGKRVLEIGSRRAGLRELQGTLRPYVESLQPEEYVGADALPGEQVDLVCPVEALLPHFGPASFDLIVCTEVLEHVADWRRAVGTIKRLCRAQGIVLVTTRSRGFPYHGFPRDFWRFEVGDMEAIFADMEVLSLRPDPQFPGVFLKARKPAAFVERDLSALYLYSILRGARAKEVAPGDLRTMRFRLLRALELARAGFHRATTAVKRLTA